MNARRGRGLGATALVAAWAGLLAACSTPRDDRPPAPSVPEPGQAYGGAADADLGRIDAAIQRYARDRAGRLPASLEDLVTERAPDGVPYLRRLPGDPWGQPYSYALLSARFGSYDLRSYGPDRLPGTADDVVARARAVPTH